jgi:hypothetical protein
MVDGQQDTILDYRGVPPKPERPWDTPEYRRWRRWRVLFRVGVILAVTPIAFYFVSNWNNFGQLLPPRPRDFVQNVEESGVPTVRAIKEYERDTGHLPDALADLVPKYLSWKPVNQEITRRGVKRTFVFRVGDHSIVYDFAPGAEGWRIVGPRANGAIPVPPVTIGPGIRTTTRATR